jgi:hypothetical protein
LKLPTNPTLDKENLMSEIALIFAAKCEYLDDELMIIGEFWIGNWEIAFCVKRDKLF